MYGWNKLHRSSGGQWLTQTNGLNAGWNAVYPPPAAVSTRIHNATT